MQFRNGALKEAGQSGTENVVTRFSSNVDAAGLKSFKRRHALSEPTLTLDLRLAQIHKVTVQLEEPCVSNKQGVMTPCYTVPTRG